MDSRSSIVNYLSSIYRIPDRDISIYYERQLKKINKPTTSNIIEILMNLSKQKIKDNLANNILNLACNFSILSVSKDRRSDLESSFVSSSKSNIPNKYDAKQIISFFKSQGIKDKNLFQFILSKKIEEVRREVSQLCFLIVIFSLQDKRPFKNIKEKFKGITPHSDFIKNFDLTKSFLRKLRKLIQKSNLRASFGCLIINSLFTLKKNIESPKNPSKEREKKFCNYIRTIFYLKNNKICRVIEKIVEFFGVDLFLIGLEVINDKNIINEFSGFLPVLFSVHLGSNFLLK